MRERFTVLMIVGTRTDVHSLRSQVGIGSVCKDSLTESYELQIQRQE